MEEKKLIPSVAREAVALPDDARRALELTPEQRQEIKKEQDRLLKLFRSRARLTPLEFQKARGIELERHHKRTGNVNALAEALAMQGRFEEAAEYAVREDLKAIFTEKAEAVASDDDDCECPRYTEDGDLFIPNQFIESEVVSTKHGAVMPAIRCRICKKLNVRQILPHLAEQRAVRRDENDHSTAAKFFSERR